MKEKDIKQIMREKLENTLPEGESNNQGGDKPDLINGYPFLSKLLFVLAGLSLIGGLILFFKFLPGDPGYGQEWRSIAYMPSIAWGVSGVIEFALFAAVGEGLGCLHQIVRNTKFTVLT